MLAVAAIAVTSCSAPKLAQQGNISDDVYGTTAQAKEYIAPKPQPVNNDLDGYDMDDYGTSDPYSDMDYYSRINRFRYGNSFRSYYDPFYSGFNNGFYGYNGFSPFYGSGLSLGFGLGMGWGNSFYGGYYDPFLWNAYNSPFWGFNNYYGGAYGGFYGSPYYGGGYLGGGYYGGGRTVNTPRPNRGRENGFNYARPGYTNGQRVTRTNGVATQGRVGRSANGNNTNSTGNTQSSRPARTENYNPPARAERPTYSPPPSYDGGGRGGSMGGGGSTGGGRPARGGRN